MDVFAWAVSGEARFLKNLRFMAPFLRIFQRTLFKFGIAELRGPHLKLEQCPSNIQMFGSSSN